MVYKKSSFGLMMICIILGILYITPKIQIYQERQQNKKIVSNCEMFSNYILKEYELNKKMNLEQKLNDGIALFLTQVQNPVNSKLPAFDNEINHGVCAVQYEKNTKSAVLTGLAKDNSIVIRIVLNPPAFVRYDRD